MGALITQLDTPQSDTGTTTNSSYIHTAEGWRTRTVPAVHGPVKNSHEQLILEKWRQGEGLVGCKGGWSRPKQWLVGLVGGTRGGRSRFKIQEDNAAFSQTHQIYKYEHSGEVQRRAGIERSASRTKRPGAAVGWCQWAEPSDRNMLGGGGPRGDWC